MRKMRAVCTTVRSYERVNRTLQHSYTTVDSQLSGLYGNKQLYKKILPLNNYMR